jgi:hypothetical protein
MEDQMSQSDDSFGIHKNYRQFIGGDGAFWDSIGNLQLDFLTSQGLKPEHKFLDIACGALRGGVKLIPYLNPDCYFGVDKHIELIIYGVTAELGLELYKAKRPRFLVTDRFDFSRLPLPPEMAIAQSLFTHLTPEDINSCLVNLRRVVARCQLFASFHEIHATFENPSASSSTTNFRYTRAQMEAFGSAAGWEPCYIGDWKHPRNLALIEYRCR